MAPEKWRAPPERGPHERLVGGSVTADRSSTAQREAFLRVVAVQKVTTAMSTGAWPVDVESLDALSALLEVAARWQLVAELGLAA